MDIIIDLLFNNTYVQLGLLGLVLFVVYKKLAPSIRVPRGFPAWTK